MGTSVKRPGSPTSTSTSTSTSKRPKQDSDSNFVTEDEEVEKRLNKRKEMKSQKQELFTTALRDHGITKTMEKAGG